MPRTCLACSHADREAIDKALVAGESFRNIAKRFGISPAALFRHKDHVAGALAKAQERREEKLSDTIFDEMKRVLAKAWELLGKMEAEDDHRGSIVALREVRECLESLNGLVTKAEGGSGGINVIIENVGVAQCKMEAERRDAECVSMEREQATSTPSTNHQSPASRAASPPSSSATEANGQSSGLAIMPQRRPRPVIGAVGYLLGMR